MTTEDDITRKDDRINGKIAAHAIADALGRDPRRVENFLAVIPDDIVFEDAIVFAENQFESVLGPLRQLRRHYIIKQWRDKQTGRMAVRLDQNASGIAWSQCLRYCALFAGQEDLTPQGATNPMKIASTSEQAGAMKFVRETIISKCQP